MSYNQQFVYQRRSPEQVRARAEASSGDFDSFLLDEFRSYKPNKGDNWIRLLPPTWTEPQPEHYGIDIWAHYDVGPNNGSVLCLAKMAQQRCPICEEVQTLQRAGSEEEAKAMRARKRVLVWLLDRKKPNDGPMLWPMPPTLDSTINKICEDRETGEVYYIDDPNAGYDVMFDRTGERMQVKYEGVQLARRPTSIDQQDMDYVVAYPLWNTLRWRTYEEIMVMFSGGMGPGTGPGAPVGRQRTSTSTPTPRSPMPPPRGPAPPPPIQQQWQPVPGNGQYYDPNAPQGSDQYYDPNAQGQQWEGHPGDPGEQTDPYTQQPQAYAQQPPPGGYAPPGGEYVLPPARGPMPPARGPMPPPRGPTPPPRGSSPPPPRNVAPQPRGPAPPQRGPAPAYSPPQPGGAPQPTRTPQAVGADLRQRFSNRG